MVRRTNSPFLNPTAVKCSFLPTIRLLPLLLKVYTLLSPFSLIAFSVATIECHQYVIVLRGPIPPEFDSQYPIYSN